MKDYGVRRLVAINSGNFIYADLDLSKAAHLAAPNNRGKSTLVNALQFLFVDDFKQMKFGRRSLDDTARHYFGRDASYLVFECATQSGIQCLVVRGLGMERTGRFERYVYDHDFRLEDYVDDDQRPVGFEVVRTRLADRHLEQVKAGHLWEVLAGNIPEGNGKGPHLNILPIRKREEYVAFRKVFVRLLSLTNVNSKVLRQLLIDCHAREIGERKIDVAADYRDAFERAERTERELQFLSEVSNLIDRGRGLREKLKDAAQLIRNDVPSVWDSVHRCSSLLESSAQKISDRLAKVETRRKQIEQERGTLQEELGTLKAWRTAKETELGELDDLHEKWSSYSPEMIREMRRGHDDCVRRVVQLEENLRSVEHIDVDVVRRRKQELERKQQRDEETLANWKRTVVATLLEIGIPEEDIDSAFRVANPSFLQMVIGDGLEVLDREIALQRLRSIAERVEDDHYEDDVIRADVSKLDGPDLKAISDRKHFKQRIGLLRADLKTQTDRLEVAEKRAEKQKELIDLKYDRDGRAIELREHEGYASKWKTRDQLAEAVRKLASEIKGTQGKIGKLDRVTKKLDKEESCIRSENRDYEQLRRTLNDAFGQCQSTLRIIELDGPLTDAEETSSPDKEAAADLPRIRRSVEATVSDLERITADAQDIRSGRDELQQVQTQISQASTRFEGQQIYFSDAGADWESLISRGDSLSELEGIGKRNWELLFKPLAARLDSILTGLQSIKNAAQRINRGLKAYQVSNLQCVEIRVEPEHTTYSMIETLASRDGLFQDPDEIDTARRRLRQMIEADQIIDLESLFSLRIRRQENDGRWYEAPSLDEIGSTGTGMTAKAMIFVQLVRAIAGKEQFQLHFYLDETGQLDDSNLAATTAMAVSQGIIPITADPDIRLEPLAHPEVTVYSLGQGATGHFFIDRHKTYRARKAQTPSVKRPAGSKDEPQMTQRK